MYSREISKIFLVKFQISDLWSAGFAVLNLVLFSSSARDLYLGTFIRGVLAHPRKYTFDHGWERAELRASLTLHVSQRARSICARRHHLQWWRHAGDAGARKGVRPVPARRRHADFRPTVHERDAQALCPETPKRRCRPVVEAGVVGRSDPYLILNLVRVYTRPCTVEYRGSPSEQ